MLARLRRIFLGSRKDLRDPGIFHRMSLIAFLAWVGLGADGLSSSAYGPDEAFRALGQPPLPRGLPRRARRRSPSSSSPTPTAAIIEHFPHGGGGYVVATKLLGPRAGVVSGSALLVDYVLTITISIAAGADAVFSFLPAALARAASSPSRSSCVVLLVLLNLRGVKESVDALMPIFLLFLVTHVDPHRAAAARHARARCPTSSHEVRDRLPRRARAPLGRRRA